MEDTVADVSLGVQTNIAGCAGFRSDFVTPAWKRRQNVRGKPALRPARLIAYPREPMNIPGLTTPDHDIHHAVPNLAALFPYMPAPWPQVLVQRSMIDLETFNYPANSPLFGATGVASGRGQARRKMAQAQALDAFVDVTERLRSTSYVHLHYRVGRPSSPNAARISRASARRVLPADPRAGVRWRRKPHSLTPHPYYA
ncbi:hypothetical protein EN852_013515 [Mesorhizobium sp. M2E.F.Ca.ET.209.01.1.1]|uniref:hypothetical protein n=1 Tax=Mesorhizobium sp. M2E.F.Ca.ET.209.01.1.1 TaxID=2500526 RepID=UPI000FDA44CD|nr:hypothetical protein [Mesorhizobium sp. M2E.F.Ca.ET.209.01.1.1]TGS14247.1 hypothetical protein EN852_013515 [Mesorhizobium sp. M2E.F.Ca.ET.209.01.1.1]